MAGQQWFTAQKTDNILYTEGDPASPLIFPDNVASYGTGYDAAASVFTAQNQGIYFFTSTLRQNNDDTYFYLKLNGNIVRQGEMGAATAQTTATISCVLLLQPGDTVHVELMTGDQIMCPECNFDGYMLYETI